uniref:phosphoribosyltransferase family protein n=1 Tax=Enterocloster aldenensis TaxID=358742 RepID=UPI00140B45FB
MVFKTIADLNKSILENLYRIPNSVDIVIGVPRSGMLVASMISVYINKPLLDISSFCEGKVGFGGNMKKHDNWKENYEDISMVLIVEDSVNSGKSLLEIKQRLSEIPYNKKIIYLAAYVTEESYPLVDMYFEVCNHPRVFEWNYMHNYLLSEACVDIDGVLCIDPSNEQNDDGNEYREFLLNAPSKLLPSQKIGYLVTSRLEKYRSETEIWLRNHNIQYNHLIMMNLNSAEERRKLNNHGEYKAAIFKKAKRAKWFIESNSFQARTISELSGKLVFCVDNQIVYSENGYNKLVQISKSRIKKMLKQYLPNRIQIFIRKML